MGQRTSPPVLPGFTYLDWLGGGGFADVFRYRDALGRGVAVKVLHQGVEADAFQAEGSLMARLSSHPHIVSIFQAGVASDGRPFLVMEECSSEHLGSRIARRILKVGDAMEVTVQIAGAIETAHRMGILHRDIKPANILFTQARRPVLTDFGISASRDQTIANHAMSPLWAPQEQYPDAGLPMGPWSDVFSLAATTWAMLVGRSPLEIPGDANDRLTLRHRVRTFTAARTGRQDVPELLEGVLATALARDPEQRYSSALEFARAVQGVQGQLNEPVTPIDVLSDDPMEPQGSDDPLDSGTRVTGFLFIDPDEVHGSSHTATMAAPTGGITSPHDRSRPGDYADLAGGSLPAVAEHGQGVGRPGLRDIPAHPVPEAAARPAALGVGSAAPSASRGPATRKRRSLGVAVAAAVLAVTGAGFAALVQAGVLRNPVATPEPSEVLSPVPQDPLAGRVAPPEGGTAERRGAKVRFGWTNPDPQPGDSYLVEELRADQDLPLERVDKPVFTSTASGKTCIKVQVRRGSGQASSPTRICSQK